MTEPEISITLLRHGRSRADDENIYEGRCDSPLTEVGRAQVESRASLWVQEGRKFDLAICSTLRRAQETAQIISGVLQIPLETDPDWMEMDNGVLAGMPVEEANRLYPEPAFRIPFASFHNSGESDWQFYCRAARAMEKLVCRGPGIYLVVAHGGILNMALRTVVETGPPVNRQGIWFAFGDTGFALVRYLPLRHRWVVEEFCRE
jgi:2,3-bisphosphoglycerate-dependent phosphoglycerate mutase